MDQDDKSGLSGQILPKYTNQVRAKSAVFKHLNQRAYDKTSTMKHEETLTKEKTPQEKDHATSVGAVLARNKVDTAGMPGAVREGVKRGRPQPQAGAKQCAL